MNPERLLARISRGDVENIDFADFCRLLEAFGFRLKRTVGSHDIYAHPDTVEILTLQPVGGKAKAYQVKSFSIESNAINLGCNE